MPSQQTTMKAILTPAPAICASKGPRFNVGVTDGAGRMIKRFLIRGPWCEATARQKARDLQHDIDAGLIRDRFPRVGVVSLRTGFPSASTVESAAKPDNPHNRLGGLEW